MVLPHEPFGSITRKRPKPMGIQHTPDFNRMQADHQWHAPNPMLEHKFLTCGECLGQMHLTTSGQTITRVWVKLPLERECFYLQANGALTPVDDQTFRGDQPKRVPSANSRENDCQPQTPEDSGGLSDSRDSSLRDSSLPGRDPEPTRAWRTSPARARNAKPGEQRHRIC